jgi:Putative metal-binding motif
MRSKRVFAVVIGLVCTAALVRGSSVARAQTNLVLSGGSMTLSGVKRYDNVCLTNGATLNVAAYNGSSKLNSGNLELIAGSVYVDASSKIIARGTGYQAALCGDGNGTTSTAGGRGGCSVMDSGGGGAHFGRGGRGTVDDPLSNGAVWEHGFPTAFEDDCNIDFDGTACKVENATRTFCWQAALHPLNSATADSATCTTSPCVGATVAGVEYWHNIYAPEFGSAGGDKGCRDGDGRSGNPMAGGGGGRVVLVGLSERNVGASVSPCGAVQGTVRIEGTIDASGKRGCGVGNDSAGGGAGGSVLIVGDHVTVGSMARISAAGGLGGDTFGTVGSAAYADCPSDAQYGGTCDDCGGGGGGGIISVLSVGSSLDPGAQFNVAGALGGTCAICNGEAGGGAGELQLDGAYVGEYCDGYDNDFDGTVDEDLGTQSCGLGSCQKSISACTSGSPVSCSPLVTPGDASCQATENNARPRIAVVLDTSASMLLDLAGYPTFGDGSLEHPGIDTKTDPDTLVNDSRLQLARESLAQVISAYPEIDFALSRYHQDQGLNRSCQTAKWFECQGLVASYDDPTGNTGTLSPACTVKIGPAVGDTINVNPIPGPVGSDCINYAGSCGAPRRGADVLSGFGTKVRDMVRWLDGKETNFSAAATSGDVCQHSDGVHDCEVRATGPTPLAGSLLAIEDYVAPIRAVDSAAQCRGYSVILVTDGAESCNGSPDAAAQHLHDALGIQVYVIAVSVLASEQASLNQIARAGSGNVRDATFVSMPQQLVPALTGIIAGSIRSEKCNSLDDDCDGKIDEDFPGLGVACDDGEKGVCKGAGAIACNAAQNGTECKLSAQGGTPGTETCNSLDDDCDGKVDEGLDCDNRPCVPSGVEVCNAKDDDCDGKVDESDPSVDHVCGETRGTCEPGRQRCVAGMLRCVGGVLPGMEVCNGKDDDCDGNIDNDAPCPDDDACIAGACRRPCLPTIEFPCPVGYSCTQLPDTDRYFCVPGPCAACKSTELCRNDTCVNPCDSVQCDDNQTCTLGYCRDCTQIGCADGQVCYDRACQDDPCKDVQCASDQLCFNGDCKALCNARDCAAGESCGADGSCVQDSCAAVSCDTGQVCRDGMCATNPCVDMQCSSGEQCVPEQGCVVDPCPVTICPGNGVCTVGSQGQPVCTAVHKVLPPGLKYVSAGGGSTCSVAHPGAGSGVPPLAAFTLLLPLWALQLRRARGRRSGKGR